MEDPARVAMVAVDDRSGGLELYGSRAHQLTPKGISGRGTSTDVDLSGLQVVERLEHQAEVARGLVVHRRDFLSERLVSASA